MYDLAPYCEILEFNNELHVGFGSVGVKLKNKKSIEIFIEILSILDQGKNIHEWLNKKSNLPEYSKLVKLLIEKNLLVKQSDIPEYNRHHREQLYFLLAGARPAKVTKLLEKKSVSIVGCGGIGALVAITLVTAGVTNITLIDDDEVEIHNISRQFAFKEADVGKKKVDILEQELIGRNSSASIHKMSQRAWFDENTSNMPKSDFVVLCADEPGIIGKANKYFVHNKIPFLHICYINDIATWGPFVVPGESGCWGCQNHIGSQNISFSEHAKTLIQKINNHYTCPIISCVSTTAVSLACLDIIKYLGEFSAPSSLNKRIGLWTHNLTFEEQNFERSSSCKICS